jgi:hypothetical protein
MFPLRSMQSSQLITKKWNIRKVRNHRNSNSAELAAQRIAIPEVEYIVKSRQQISDFSNRKGSLYSSWNLDTERSTTPKNSSASASRVG